MNFLKLTAKISILISLVISLHGCGQVEMAGRTESIAPTSIPLLLTGTDYYVEIGLEFSSEVAKDIKLTFGQMLATALWAGASNLGFEMRISLQGNAAPNSVVFLGNSVPADWGSATMIFNQNVTGGNVANDLQSGDLKSIMTSIIEQQRFWIFVRVRAQGADAGKSLTIRDVQAYVQGLKNLKNFSPSLNLTF